MPSKIVKQPKKSKSTWVKVVWKDHFSQELKSGWGEDLDITPVLVTSVGVVVKENKEVVTLAQNLSDGGHRGNTMNILKALIKSRKTL